MIICLRIVVFKVIFLQIMNVQKYKCQFLRLHYILWEHPRRHCHGQLSLCSRCKWVCSLSIVTVTIKLLLNLWHLCKVGWKSPASQAVYLCFLSHSWYGFASYSFLFPSCICWQKSLLQKSSLKCGISAAANALNRLVWCVRATDTWVRALPITSRILLILLPHYIVTTLTHTA